MKEVKLVERKPSERLICLVDAIPEFEILNNRVICRDSHRTSHAIYSITEGCINMRYNKDLVHYNPLRNSKKLLIANDSFSHITEESFCDLLNEHLYLVAKEKMEELLPQIQEHYPDAFINGDNIIHISIVIPISKNFRNILVDTDGGNVQVHPDSEFEIWEDKEKLIVAKPQPWWETQHDYYNCQTMLPHLSEFVPVKHAIKNVTRTQVGIYAGISTFKTKEEAQAMCDKLNEVLKGE